MNHHQPHFVAQRLTELACSMGDEQLSVRALLMRASKIITDQYNELDSLRNPIDESIPMFLRRQVGPVR